METIQGFNEVMARLASLESSQSVQLILLYPSVDDVSAAEKGLEQVGLIVAKRFRHVPGLAANGQVAIWQAFLLKATPQPAAVHWDETVQAWDEAAWSTGQ